MSGFTPGPWEDYFDGQSIEAKDGKVASTWVEGRTDEEVVANAKLIAAAPDGYNAAILAIEHMEWSTPQGKKAYEALKAFIAKADGGQS